MQKTKLLSRLLVAFFILIFAHNVSADTGIKISPTRFEELVDPGETINYKIKVTNQSDVETTMKAFLKDFTAGDEDGKANLIEPGSSEGSFMSSWVGITADQISFGPSETKEIPFTVKVPADAGPGGYYGAVVFGTVAPNLKPGEVEKGATIGVAQQTGALILLRVAGDVFEEARVREFVTDREIYSTPFDVKFLTRIENIGNVHVRPYGTVEISNMFGKNTGVVRVNEKGSNAMPKSIRRFEESWAGDFGFGKYKATLVMSYGASISEGGQGKKSLYAEKTFWIIPWKIVGPALISFGIMIILIVLFLKFYKSRAIKAAMLQMGIQDNRIMAKKKGRSSSAHFSLILLSLFIVFLLLAGLLYFIFFA